MRKNQILSLVLSAFFLVGILAGAGVFVRAQSSGETFVYGTGSGPAYIDPANAWDEASLDVIEQCCEGLVMYNLSASIKPTDPSVSNELRCLVRGWA